MVTELLINPPIYTVKASQIAIRPRAAGKVENGGKGREQRERFRVRERPRAAGKAESAGNAGKSLFSKSGKGYFNKSTCLNCQRAYYCLKVLHHVF